MFRTEFCHIKEKFNRKSYVLSDTEAHSELREELVGKSELKAKNNKSLRNNSGG